MAKLVLARSARNALAKLDFLLADAILDALAELERDPHAGHALRGRLAGLRSYRVGAYRIIHELRDESTVWVVAIRHRGQAYQTDPRLIRRRTTTRSSAGGQPPHPEATAASANARSRNGSPNPFPDPQTP